MIKDQNKKYYGLIDIMNRKGVTQASLANELGISRWSFNSKLYRKEGNDFKLNEGLRICKALKIKTTDFF